MKRLKTTLVALIASAALFAAAGDDGRPISFDSLPKNTKDFIVKHFNSADISFAKEDKELFDKSYEVFFTDGSKIEFDKNGEWESIDCSKSRKPVPVGIIPEPIESYVRKNHSDFTIVKIDRDRRDFEIELNSGIEIKFDRRYNVIGYDD